MEVRFCLCHFLSLNCFAFSHSGKKFILTSDFVWVHKHTPPNHVLLLPLHWLVLYLLYFVPPTPRTPSLLSFWLEKFYLYVAGSPLWWPAPRRWRAAVLILCQDLFTSKNCISAKGRGRNNDSECGVQYLLLWVTRVHAWVYSSVLNLFIFVVLVGKRSRIHFLPQLWPLKPTQTGRKSYEF